MHALNLQPTKARLSLQLRMPVDTCINRLHAQPGETPVVPAHPVCPPDYGPALAIISPVHTLYNRCSGWVHWKFRVASVPHAGPLPAAAGCRGLAIRGRNAQLHQRYAQRIRASSRAQLGPLARVCFRDSIPHQVSRRRFAASTQPGVAVFSELPRGPLHVRPNGSHRNANGRSDAQGAFCTKPMHAPHAQACLHERRPCVTLSGRGGKCPLLLAP